jgi:hypothetical protein
MLDVRIVAPYAWHVLAMARRASVTARATRRVMGKSCAKLPFRSTFHQRSDTGGKLQKDCRSRGGETAAATAQPPVKPQLSVYTVK